MTNIAKMVIVALVVSTPAVAQTAPTDSASAATATQKLKDPNRVICEREEVIGSRLGGKKICRTAAEWEAARQQARDEIDDWQRRRPGPKPGDPG
jgi:hypothetical protein